MNTPEDDTKTREQDDDDTPPAERPHLRLVRTARDSSLLFRGLVGPKKPPVDGE